MHGHLKFRKVCAQWVPRELKHEKKINQMYLPLQHILWNADEGEDMFNRIVTGDGSWVHHYQPESKACFIAGETSQFTFIQKILRSCHQLGILCFSFFGILRELLLAHFQKCSETVNSAYYCEVPLMLWDAIRRKHPGQLARMVLLHHDNDRPRTAQATQERIQELQRELLEHPPYSPDLAPDGLHLFGPVKNHRGGKRFADGEEVETEVQKWLRQQSKTSVLWVLMH
jgi:histone-lysine N-methyltransferase SETMAR